MLLAEIWEISTLLNQFSTRIPRLNTTTSLIAFVISASSCLFLHCSTATQTLRWIWFVYRFQRFRLMHSLTFALCSTPYAYTPLFWTWLVHPFHYCIVSLLLRASSTLFLKHTPSFLAWLVHLSLMRILFEASLFCVISNIDLLRVAAELVRAEVSVFSFYLGRLNT